MRNPRYQRLLYFIFLISHSLFGQAQKEDGFVISGQIKGLKDGEVVKMYVEEGDDNWKNGDSCIVKNGSFILKGDIVEGPRQVQLNMGYHPEANGGYFPAILIGNERVTLEGSIEPGIYPEQSIRVTGSQYNSDLRSLMPVVGVWSNSLRDLFNNYMHNGAVQRRGDSLGYDRSFMEGVEFTRNIIQRNVMVILDKPDNLAIPFIFKSRYSYVGHESLFPALYKRMSEAQKNSYYGKWMQTRLIYCKGQLAPVFTSTTPEGRSLSSAEIIKKNKLTLIDFWKSNCIPCRREFRTHTIGLYKEFHLKGWEIIGVSSDDDAGPWKKAIKEDALPWLQVSGLKGWSDPAYITYKISVLPANILVDQEGKIIDCNLDGPELHWYLDKLLR